MQNVQQTINTSDEQNLKLFLTLLPGRQAQQVEA